MAALLPIPIPTRHRRPHPLQSTCHPNYPKINHRHTFHHSNPHIIYPFLLWIRGVGNRWKWYPPKMSIIFCHCGMINGMMIVRNGKNEQCKFHRLWMRKKSLYEVVHIMPAEVVAAAIIITTKANSKQSMKVWDFVGIIPCQMRIVHSQRQVTTAGILILLLDQHHRHHQLPLASHFQQQQQQQQQQQLHGIINTVNRPHYLMPKIQIQWYPKVPNALPKNMPDML